MKKREEISKQDKAENIMRLVIILLILVITCFLTARKLLNDGTFKSYDDCKNSQITYQKVLSQKPTQYYVLVYSDKCEGSEKIEKYIIQYIESNRNKDVTGVTLYLLNADKNQEIIDTENNILGVNNYMELKIKNSPTMLLIENNQVSNSFTSASTILEQLKK